MQTIVVLFVTETPVAAVPPKVTDVAPVKAVPVIVTDVPPPGGPLFGEQLVTVGAAIKVKPLAFVPDPEELVTTTLTAPAA